MEDLSLLLYRLIHGFWAPYKMITLIRSLLVAKHMCIQEITHCKYYPVLQSTLNLTDTYSLVYKDAPQNNISWVLNQTVSICPYTDYTFTFWTRSNGERNPTHCPIDVCFNDTCEQVADLIDIDFIWLQLQSQYYGGSAGVLEVSISTASCGQFILLDEISFNIASIAPLPPATTSTVDCSSGYNSTICESTQGCYWSDYYAHCFPY